MPDGAVRKALLTFAALGLALVACNELEAERHPVEPAPPERAAPARKAVPEATGPVRGEVKGRAFAVEDATLEEGILKLRQGEDFFADLEVTVFLFLDEKDTLPEGRSWGVDCEGGWSSDVPHVHVAWRAGGEDVPKHDSIVCDYTMQLSLGQETADGRIPGRIVLSAPTLQTRIAGTFEAEVEGFVRRDGVVDLSKDDLDVAHHVAGLWLGERAGAPVEVVDHALAWLHNEKPEGRPQAGFAVYRWRPESGGETRVAKLQFEKREGVWTVARALESWQVARAHTNSPRNDVMGALSRRAAARFEEEHVARNGKVPVFVSEVRTTYNPQKGLAETKLRYTLDEDELDGLGWFWSEKTGHEVRYLFRSGPRNPDYKNPDVWELERRLAPGEVVDFKEGRVRAG
jgi:hypothetical protein